MKYFLIATSKLNSDVLTQEVDAASDAAAIEFARLWKCSMADGFHQLVQAAVATSTGEQGNIIGTAE